MSKIILQPSTLITPELGAFEWDGKVPYFTPQGSQRGLVPGMQYYRLNSPVVGTNATGAQSVFGVGVTLSANTIYAFQGFFAISKTAGTTSHTLSYGFGGTATSNNFLVNIKRSGGAQALPLATATASGIVWVVNNSAALTVGTGAVATAAYVDTISVEGTVSVAAGGTFIPQYAASAAPGGAYTTAAGSWFSIYPVGKAGSATNIGTWA